MAELKTKPTKADVEKFLNGIKDDKKREDSFKILKLMKQITGEDPKMWGSSIIGFGSYHYKYASGREGDWFLAGFSPRKQSLTIYTMAYVDKHKDLLKKLGDDLSLKSQREEQRGQPAVRSFVGASCPCPYDANSDRHGCRPDRREHAGWTAPRTPAWG